MPHSPKHSSSANDSNSLARQNQELRDRLQMDAARYRRRIDTYEQSQQNQAALVARLQSKVLQYKKKCNELEDRMIETVGPPSPITKSPIKVIDCVGHFKNDFTKTKKNEMIDPIGMKVRVDGISKLKLMSLLLFVHIQTHTAVWGRSVRK